jgi:hypothetical protein
MKEKIRALREYRAEQRKLLGETIDKVVAKSEELYPRARQSAEAELAELADMEKELADLEDDINQGLGGNRPPPGSGSSG